MRSITAQVGRKQRRRTGADRLRLPLLSSCAIAAALIVAGHPHPALGQAFQGTGTTALGTPATIATDGRSQRGQRLPSTSTISGSIPKVSTVRVTASIRAQ